MHRTLFMEVLHSIRYSLLLPYWLCYCSVTSVVSDSVRPHRRHPTRLRRPWDSPGKNTGVGCHFLLQCMKVKSESEVAQSCPTLSDPMGCSLPGSSAHGIFQARVLEWGTIAFSGKIPRGWHVPSKWRTMRCLEHIKMWRIIWVDICSCLWSPSPLWLGVLDHSTESPTPNRLREQGTKVTQDLKIQTFQRV